MSICEKLVRRKSLEGCQTMWVLLSKNIHKVSCFNAFTRRILVQFYLSKTIEQIACIRSYLSKCPQTPLQMIANIKSFQWQRTTRRQRSVSVFFNAWSCMSWCHSPKAWPRLTLVWLLTHSLTHASYSPPQTTAIGLYFQLSHRKHLRLTNAALVGSSGSLPPAGGVCRNANGAVQMFLIVSCEMTSLQGWFSARSYEGCIKSLNLLLTDDFTITTNPQLCNYSKKCCLVTL